MGAKARAQSKYSSYCRLQYTHISDTGSEARRITDDGHETDPRTEM